MHRPTTADRADADDASAFGPPQRLCWSLR
jgi:hypothetical protein